MILRINGETWKLCFVSPTDPILRVDDGYTLGVTIPVWRRIYISNAIEGSLLRKVFIHELCHAFVYEYGIYLPIYYEEVFADALATYGEVIINKGNMLCAYCNKC